MTILVSFLPLLGILIIFLAILAARRKIYPSQTDVISAAFSKKKYLFDSASEFQFFHTLQALVGDKYYIFPQVGYAHLFTEVSTNEYVKRKYRSMIDRKSADFVLCDKINLIPQIIIELNGSYHSLPDRIKRDQLVQGIAKYNHVPLVTIDVRDIENKDLVLKQISEVVA